MPADMSRLSASYAQMSLISSAHSWRSWVSRRKSAARAIIIFSISSLHSGWNPGWSRWSSRHSLALAFPGGTSLQNCIALRTGQRDTSLECSSSHHHHLKLLLALWLESWLVTVVIQALLGSGISRRHIIVELHRNENRSGSHIVGIQHKPSHLSQSLACHCAVSPAGHNGPPGTSVPRRHILTEL